MNARRFASIAGTTAVTVIAAAGSYDHMRTLALAAGQNAALATFLPASVDGLALVATVALGDGRVRRGSAWFALILAAGVSLAANVLAAGPTALDRCVSAWPSLAMLACVEVIARAGRAPAVAVIGELAVTPGTPAVTPGTPEAAPASARVAARRVTGTGRAVANGTAAKVAALVAEAPHLATAEVAERLGISPRTARRYRSATVAA